MTKQRDLKHKIRARMKKTGERYTAARAHVLGQAGPRRPADVRPRGVLDGYRCFGGLQDDTAVVGNMFAHAGVAFSATGAPYTEAMLHGLCGGVGFLYAVFEYKGWGPTLTMVPRSRSMPQTYLAPLFERVGVEASTQNSSSDAAAKKKLDAALDAQKPVLCLVDAALLPHSPVPQTMAGAGPHHVAVVGREGDDYWVDDRALQPLRMSAQELSRARAAYKAGKRALTVFGDVDEEHDWESAWCDALVDTAQTLEHGDPTVPKSFRSNCGLAGMAKWRRLLVDGNDKKAWARVFKSERLAFLGLRRSYDGICHEYTAPAAGRPLYAEFLDAAAEHLERPGLELAAKHFRSSADAWRAMATTIAETPDPAVKRACELADARAQALDAGVDEGRAAELAALVEERMALGKACKLSASEAAKVYAQMAEHLDDIIAAETAGAAALRSAMA